MRYRVAITGIGIISALGTTCERVAHSLYAGTSGVVIDPERQALGFLSPLTGAIEGFVPHPSLSRKQRKTMPDFAQWAHAATMQAIEGSGLDPADLHNDRTGVLFGNDSSTIAAVEQVASLRELGATSSIGSGHVFRAMNSCISMNLSTILGTQGASWTIAAACASGGHAIGQAADLIALGRQDRMICGGAQEINWQALCSFDGIGAFSCRTDAPAKASRPFDAHRDGLVPSGGAAAVLLERYDLAKQQGRVILGEVAGYGFSADGENIAVPSRHGLGRAMRNALHDAGATPGDIDYLCAHATSTPAGDSMEAGNICDVFGPHGVPVSSTKGLTGHELWMSGASQVVYTTLMAQNGFTAANANFEAPDEASALLDIICAVKIAPPTTALCNAAGFGGTNSSLVLRFGT